MGSVGYVRLVRSDVAPDDPEQANVDGLAKHLRAHPEACSEEIDAAHVYRAQSKVIQLIVSKLLKDTLGFDEEIVLTPQDGLVVRPRPDFVYHLDSGRGVLAEVERGGTTANNRDLKDLWKTHLSPDAQHLFLVVPHANWDKEGRAREHSFHRVTARLSTFFGDERREIDVMSAHIFGYGQAIVPGRPAADIGR